MVVRLTFIRHGHTAANNAAGPRMSGWTDFPLSSLGRQQVQALRSRLEKTSFEALYSSPLRRAADTAGALTCLAPCDLRLLDDLREISCGEVDGHPVEEVKRRYPELWESNLRQDDEHLRWPGGESYREFRQRCLSAVQRIASAHPGERVAIVTHAGVVCQVIGSIVGTHPAQWERFRPGNCSLTEIEWRGENGRLLLFDDRDHLEGLGEEGQGLTSSESAGWAWRSNTRPPSG